MDVDVEGWSQFDMEGGNWMVRGDCMRGGDWTVHGDCMQGGDWMVGGDWTESGSAAEGTWNVFVRNSCNCGRSGHMTKHTSNATVILTRSPAVVERLCDA